MIKWRVTNNLCDPHCIRVAMRRETKRARVIVSYRLMQIADLADRAATAKWCVTTLAQNCGVSVPTLERFFHETKQQNPRDWINAEQMRHACVCLMAGRNVFETSDDLGYGSQHAFSLAFKKFHGYPPSLHRKRMEEAGRKSKNNSHGSRVDPPSSDYGATRGRESRASEGRARHSVRAAFNTSSVRLNETPDPKRQTQLPTPKSEIGNRKSEIGNRKSEIGNHSSWSQIRL